MYKYDIHVHTAETSPCGKVDAIDIVRLYKEIGYTGIVITDHYYRNFFDNSLGTNWKMKVEDYLKGYKKAFKEGVNIGLNVLLGMEIKFNDNPNDYLVYGIDEEFLLANPELYNLRLDEFRKLINCQDFVGNRDVLIYQAHPFRKGQNIEDPRLLDGIEVYNGHPRHESRNDLALEYAIQNKLKMISGSDFHQVPDLARGGIMVNDNITTIAELVLVLKGDRLFELIKTNDFQIG